MQREQTWDVLEEVLKELFYQREIPPHDRFHFDRRDHENYAVLYIYTYNPNSYDTDRMRLTQHEFVVPLCTYHEQAWVRWVFERIASIEFHEVCESFLYKGERIYAPHHGNGWDPYTFWPGHDVNEKKKAPGED